MSTGERIFRAVCAVVGGGALVASALWAMRDSETVDAQTCAEEIAAVQEAFATVADPAAITTSLTANDCGGHDAERAGLQRLLIEINGMRGTTAQHFEELRDALIAIGRDPRLHSLTMTDRNDRVSVSAGSLTLDQVTPEGITLEVSEHLSRLAESSVPVAVESLGAPTGPRVGGPTTHATARPSFDGTASDPAGPAAEAWTLLSEFGRDAGVAARIELAGAEGDHSIGVYLDVPAEYALPETFHQTFEDAWRLAEESRARVSISVLDGAEPHASLTPADLTEEPSAEHLAELERIVAEIAGWRVSTDG